MPPEMKRLHSSALQLHIAGPHVIGYGCHCIAEQGGSLFPLCQCPAMFPPAVVIQIPEVGWGDNTEIGIEGRSKPESFKGLKIISSGARTAIFLYFYF